MAMEGDEYEVFFVDYGDMEWVEKCHVRSLLASLSEVCEYYVLCDDCLLVVFIMHEMVMCVCGVCEYRFPFRLLNVLWNRRMWVSILVSEASPHF